MAQYKVPQDVEADDKLLGPFNFRQFIYLLIVAALIALAWALFQLFPLLAIFPLPFAFFLLILALPLRKDQPMETYIAALISFYTKPNKRFWFPGQRESTISITAPKIVEKVLTKNLTEEEAGRRLSFLANIVDSEGYSIKDGLVAPTDSPVRDEFIAEAESTPDIFENYQSTQVATDLSSEADRHRAEVIQQMRAAIAANNPIVADPAPAPEPPAPTFNVANLTQSSQPTPAFSPLVQPQPLATTQPQPIPEATRSRLVELSKNNDFTVATIAKEANRKPKKRPVDKDEVYISLH
ncbi:PrgI family protein [Candidatus Saccharibacteria bacterium]|nr:PrgI family protein [Candidatus Saccharibacteria bacterium]